MIHGACEVNYRYKMDEVSQNHERYHRESRVEVSKHVYELYVSIFTGLM